MQTAHTPRGLSKGRHRKVERRCNRTPDSHSWPLCSPLSSGQKSLGNTCQLSASNLPGASPFESKPKSLAVAWPLPVDWARATPPLACAVTGVWNTLSLDPASLSRVFHSDLCSREPFPRGFPGHPSSAGARPPIPALCSLPHFPLSSDSGDLHRAVTPQLEGRLRGNRGFLLTAGLRCPEQHLRAATGTRELEGRERPAVPVLGASGPQVRVP